MNPACRKHISFIEKQCHWTVYGPAYFQQVVSDRRIGYVSSSLTSAHRFRELDWIEKGAKRLIFRNVVSAYKVQISVVGLPGQSLKRSSLTRGCKRRIK